MSKAANEGVLRNRCSRGVLALENRGVLGEIPKIAFLSKCGVLSQNFIVVLGKIVPPGKMRCSKEENMRCSREIWKSKRKIVSSWGYEVF